MDAAAARALPTAVRPPPVTRRADTGLAPGGLVDAMPAATVSCPAVVPPNGGGGAVRDPVVSVVRGGGDSGGGGGGGGGDSGGGVGAGGGGNFHCDARTRTVHGGGA